MRTTSLIPVACLCGLILAESSSAGEEEFDLAEIEFMDPGKIHPVGTDALVWDPASHASVNRALSVPLPRTIPKGYLQYVIEHRARTPIDDDPVDNFLGFDGGNVKIGFGLTYGLMDNLEVGVYRINGTVERFDTYQFSGKLHALRETDHRLDLAVLGGGTVFTIDDEEDDSGGFGSLLLGRSFSKYLYVSAGGLFHSNSSSFDKTGNDEHDSTSILGSVNAHLSPSMMLAGEFSVPVDGYEAKTTVWAGGVKFVTHGHTFSLVFGNTQYISLDGLAAGTSFDSDEVVFGFSITRAFELGGG